MTVAIETIGLVKKFGETRALDGINLKIQQGSVYGLLGPNGAGKTTTIRILATLLKPTEGKATVLGQDVVREAASVRARVGLTGQYASVDEELTGHENLVLIGRLLGLSWKAANVRSAELLSAFGLSDAATRLARTYSGGMRRRIDIAAGLVFTPEIVFLDEPTTGLDPRSRSQVWDIVRAIAAQGTTVLLTTQYMEEADRLADRLAVIDHGRVIAEGTSQDLKSSVGASTLRVRLYNAEDRAAAETKLTQSMALEILPGNDPLSFVANIAREAQIPEIFQTLSGDGIRLAEFATGQPSMDDVFFALTGHLADNKSEDGEVQS
ncbi:MAG: ATP-binding cassette domain-containing protein [Spirochaetia bacterium]|nr:ATP-binding cassette domain-containing protein [Spirochaetia bacterium]